MEEGPRASVGLSGRKQKYKETFKICQTGQSPDTCVHIHVRLLFMYLVQPTTGFNAHAHAVDPSCRL